MKKPEFTGISKTKKEYTNADVLYINEILQGIKDIRSLKVNSAIIGTLENLKPYVERLSSEKLIPPSEEVKEYRQKVRTIIEEFSKDENGVPKKKIVGEGRNQQEVFDVDMDNPDMTAQLDELTAEYKESLDAYTAEVNEYNAFLGEKAEFDVDSLLVKVEEKHFPSDISTEDYARLYYLVKDK